MPPLDPLFGAPRGGAAINAVTGGLPDELRSTLVETPPLPEEILAVTAAPTANTLQAYEISFTCALPDERQQLLGAELFVRENTLVITPTFERTAGDLQARSRHAPVLITIPAGVLNPGNYTVTLVGTRTSRARSSS